MLIDRAVFWRGSGHEDTPVCPLRDRRIKPYSYSPVMYSFSLGVVNSRANELPGARTEGTSNLCLRRALQAAHSVDGLGD